MKLTIYKKCDNCIEGKVFVHSSDIAIKAKICTICNGTGKIDTGQYIEMMQKYDTGTPLMPHINS